MVFRVQVQTHEQLALSGDNEYDSARLHSMDVLLAQRLEKTLTKELKKRVAKLKLESINMVALF